MMARFVMFLLVLSVLAACEDPVDLDLHNASPELVLISNFAPGQPLQVQVSRTRSPLNPRDTLFLDNATVELYQGETLLETLEVVPGTQPFYTTRNVTPSIGTNYTIRAEAPDFLPVSATSSVPLQTDIRLLRLSNIEIFPAEGGRHNVQYEVQIVFDDPAERINFYHLNFYQQILEYRVINNDTILINQSVQKIRFSSELDDNSLTAYFQGGVLFDDKVFNGSPIAYSFPLQFQIDPRRETVGKMFAELRSVSKEYYLFHNSLSRQQTSVGGPIAEPVIIYDNVENGQGIFAGYNAAVDSVVIQF